LKINQPTTETLMSSQEAMKLD